MSRGISQSQRLSSRRLAPSLVVASALLLSSILLVLVYIVAGPVREPQRKLVVSNATMVDVLVATHKIEVGTPLEPSLFRKESRSAGAIASSAIRSFDEIKSTFATSFVPEGQVLVKEYLSAQQPLNEIQADIPDGYRAVSLAVDNTTSVEGWARPGAKVDVVLTSLVNSRAAITVVIQNAKVLSAGRSTRQSPQGDKEEGASTVTLMVSVDEAAKLKLADSAGKLSLALRGDEDTIESVASSTVLLDSLVAADGPRAPAPIPSEGRVKVEGKVFLIVNGKLVPEESVTH
jgi:pilus assembly protein CpaB